MANNNFNNGGPVTIAENMRDNYSFAIFNAPAARELDPLSLNVPPMEISLKPISKPHADFTGRVEYVNSAIECLSHPIATDVRLKFSCLVIHALGGYGKTQTARKIASVCSKMGKFQHFMWIDSEDDTTIKKCFVALGEQIGLASPNFDSLLHRFYKLLVGRKHEKFLIIFDNVENFDKILNYLPLDYPASNIAVLITSQHPFTRTSYGSVTNQQLDLLLEEEAMQLVDKILGRSSMDYEQDKKLLVERSGRITLVLCVMASTIKFQRKYDRGYKIEDYLRKIRNEPAEYGDESKTLELNYEKSLQTIVRYAVDKLEAVGGPLGKVAVKVFDRLAYFSATNTLREYFVEKYLRDICDQAKSMNMKLPMKPADDLQILRMAIEKLSEFSLAQLSYDQCSVHRWIQASRRLELKRSGNGRNTLKELLYVVPQMYNYDENNMIIWEHVTDYPDLVNEFYAEKRTLKVFPYRKIDVFEKIIGVLIQNADLRRSEQFSDHSLDLISDRIPNSDDLDELKRLVKALDYDMSHNSAKFLSAAIDNAKLNVVKWLINEKSCAPQKCHLQRCSTYFRYSEISLQKLQPLNIHLGEIIEQNSGKNLLDCLFICALNKLESFHSWASRCIESYDIESILSSLEYSGSSKEIECESESEIRSTLPVFGTELNVGFAKIIQQNTRKSLLECLFHYALKNVRSFVEYPGIEICYIIRIMLCALEKLLLLNIHSGEKIVERNPHGNNLLEHLFHTELNKWSLSYMYRTGNCIRVFEIVGVIWRAMGTSTELTETLQKYSERNVFECICHCDLPHEQ